MPHDKMRGKGDSIDEALRHHTTFKSINELEAELAKE